MSFLLCVVIYLCFTTSKGKWVDNKGLWYYISQGATFVSYQQAARRCESMNARLAVITKQDQNDFIRKNTDDGIQRWIGLSNNKHGYTNTGCKHKQLVWDYDLGCDIKFKIFENNYDKSESTSCMAVITKDGMWALHSCTDVFGFICQWECKKIYLHFETLKVFSGIYELSHYWGGNIVYRKQETGGFIEIWKTRETDWELNKRESERYITKVFHKSSLYVPYGELTSWMTPGGTAISSTFFCIECNKLSVCVNAESDNERCYSQLTLTFDDNSNPEYIDETADVIINNHYNSYYCICVDQQSDCGHRCGYIFPYPQRATTTTLNDKSKVSITNLCLPEDETISAKPDKDVTTSTISNKSNTNTTSVTVSVVILVIIIILAILVTCFVLLRRNFSESSSHANNTINNNDRLTNEVATYDNMYVDINEAIMDNTAPAISNKGQYSYADLDNPTNITPKVNISTEKEVVKVRCCVQNDDLTSRVNDNKEGKDEMYAKVNKPQIPAAHIMEGLSKTETQSKLLIKTELDTKTKQVQHTDDDSKLSNDNPAIYNNGDDDLEIFENSVYESTQR